MTAGERAPGLAGGSRVPHRPHPPPQSRPLPALRPGRHRHRRPPGL